MQSFFADAVRRDRLDRVFVVLVNKYVRAIARVKPIIFSVARDSRATRL